MFTYHYFLIQHNLTIISCAASFFIKVNKNSGFISLAPCNNQCEMDDFSFCVYCNVNNSVKIIFQRWYSTVY
jgi:hypothetical protein